jgi:hypothetical protein
VAITSLGDTWFKTTSKIQTFSAGLTVFGFSLSSQAGYSTSGKIAYNFDAKGNVCGSNSTGPAGSPKV